MGLHFRFRKRLFMFTFLHLEPVINPVNVTGIVYGVGKLSIRWRVSVIFIDCRLGLVIVLVTKLLLLS